MLQIRSGASFQYIWLTSALKNYKYRFSFGEEQKTSSGSFLALTGVGNLPESILS